MLSIYPAIFYKEKEDGYSVVFPDLNHLATCGEDLSEAMEMAVDCLAGYLFSANRKGESVPSPTPIEKLDPHCEDDEDSDYESVLVNLVSVDVESYAEQHFEKPVKKTLTIFDSLNEKAVEMKLNFSELLTKRLSKLFSTGEKVDTSSSFEFPKIPTIPAISTAAALGLGMATPATASGLSKSSKLSGIASLIAAGVAGATILSAATSDKSVKKTITIPKWLNDEATARGVNFSAELRNAIVEEIAARENPKSPE